MEQNVRHRTASRAGVMLAAALSAMLAGLSGGCGSGSPATPAATPTPELTPPAFVYVHSELPWNAGAPSTVEVYEARDPGGVLSKVHTYAFPGMLAFAVDPSGRFVYTRFRSPGLDFIRVYGVDAVGGLTELSELPGRSPTLRVALVAGETDLFERYRDPQYEYTGFGSLRRDDSGTLNPEASLPCYLEGTCLVEPVPGQRRVYVVDDGYQSYRVRDAHISAVQLAEGKATLLASTPIPLTGPDASAALIGDSVLVVADERGRLTSYSLDRGTGVASAQSQAAQACLTAPDASEDDPPFASLGGGAGSLLAVADVASVCAYVVLPSGELGLLASAATPRQYSARRPALHPSGEFLYALDGDNLRTYRVQPQVLEGVSVVPHVSGELLVAPAPAP